MTGNSLGGRLAPDKNSSDGPAAKQNLTGQEFGLAFSLFRRER